MTQTVKNLPAVQETRVWSLSWEDPLEKEMTTHSSILAWRIPWQKETAGLQSMGLQRVGHSWATFTHSLSIYISLFGFFSLVGYYRILSTSIVFALDGKGGQLQPMSSLGTLPMADSGQEPMVEWVWNSRTQNRNETFLLGMLPDPLPASIISSITNRHALVSKCHANIESWRSSQFSSEEQSTIRDNYVECAKGTCKVDWKLCGKVGSVGDILEEVAFSSCWMTVQICQAKSRVRANSQAEGSP